MIEGSCHCGAVSFTLKTEPDWLTICNCTLCRRIRGVWGAARPADVELRHAPDATIGYTQGDRTLTTHSCKTCGCTTHWLPTDPAYDRMKVNLAMADPAAIAHLRIRHFDGADTWDYLD